MSARTTRSTDSRVRIAQVITCLALAWPLAHFALVRAFELSPWSFGGFAMYTTPRPTLQARDPLMGEAHAPLKAIAVQGLPAAIREHVLAVLGESLQARGVLGTLYDPTVHAAQLLELSPSASHVVLSIEQCKLDAHAFTSCETLQYLCTRPSQPAAPRCTRSARELHAGDIVE